MSKKTFHLCIALVLFLLILPLWAAESDPKHEGGLLDIHPGLIFWTIVTFVTLVVVLKIFAWKPLLQMIDERERHVRDTLEGSEKARREATELLEKGKKNISEAHMEAKTILEKADKKAHDLRKELLHSTEKEVAELKQNSQREIEGMRNNIVLSQLGQIGDLGIEIASKIMNRSIAKEEHSHLIDESIHEIQERIDSRVKA